LNAVVISSVLTLDGVQTTGSTTLDECDITLTGASTYATQALVPPTVSTINLNTTSAPGVNAVVNLKMAQDPGPAGNFILDTAYLNVTYYIPYVAPIDTLYWYGNSGDWTDANHWSYNSGNIPPSPATCIPSVGDHVIFDNLSFSSDGQTVNVDGESYFASMTWQALDDSAQLLMNENLTASEDVIWSPQLEINKGTTAGVFRFQPRGVEAILDPNNASVDVSLEVISFNLNDTLTLMDSLNNGDFNSIIIYGGVVNTNNNYIHSNSLLITSAFTPSELNMGSSLIELVAGYADYAGDSSFVNCGTSTIRIDHQDLVSTNYFRGNNQDFHNVELNFNSNNYSVISGSNVFDSLTVGAGSKLVIDSLSNNTINNGFVMLGTCQDSIFLKSNGGSNYTFTSSALLDAMCLNVQRATATSVGAGTFTTYFSTNAANNNGDWVFDTSPSTTAIIDTMFNFCFGDTLNFVNGSTVFLNDFVNLTSIWNFGDGQNFVGDTTQHYYNFPGQYNFKLISQYSNFCTDTIVDTIQIYAPSVSIYSSIGDTLMCEEQPISFYANTSSDSLTQSLFEFIIDGVPTSVPTLNYDQLDTLSLNSPSLISVNLYENGCIASSDTISMTILPVPTVNLSVLSTTICLGQSVTFIPSGATQYKYYRNGVAVTPFTSIPYVTSSIVNGDTYFVVGKNTSTGCADTSNILTFVVNALPTLTSLSSSDANNIICAGDLVTFTGASPSATTYNFYLNNILIVSSASPTLSIDTLSNGDQISLILQDVNLCLSTQSTSITHLVNPIPSVAVTSTSPGLTICEGTSVLFTASNANLYQYQINGIPIGIANTNPYYETDSLVNGDIITVIGETFGCIGTTSGITFTVNGSPVTTLVSNIGSTICSGNQIIMTANSANATNFLFALNGTTVANGTDSTYTFTALSNGDLISVIGSFNGCSFTDYMPITVFNNPVPSIFSSDGNNTICEQNLITFTGTGANVYQYFINGTSSFIGGGPYSTDSLISGNNTVLILATNTVTGCSAYTPGITVNVIELPVTNLTSSTSTICAGELVNFTASSGIADSYQYFINSVSQGLPTSNTLFSSNILANGDAVFVIGYNDGCPNPGIDTLITTVNPNPVASLTGTTIFCEGTPEIFTGSSSIPGSNFEFIIDGTTVSLISTFNCSALSAGAHLMKLVVSSPAGCTDTIYTNINVIDNPTVTLSGNSNICSGETTTFVAGGTMSYEYFVNGTSTFTNSIYSTNSLNNGDIITLVGTSGAGCSAQSATQITMNVATTPSVTLMSSDLDNILCTGENVLFTAIGGTNYEFFINGISQGAPSASNTFSTTSLTNGQVVTVEGESNGCIDYSSTGIPFSVSNSPIVSLVNGADTVLCVDTPTQLTASGANDYLFYINGIPQGIFSSTNTLNTLLNNGDIVSVEGMTNTCITLANDVFEFSVFNYPNTTLSSSDVDNTICSGDEVTFTGSGALQYEYFIDGLSLGLSGQTYITSDIENGQTISIIGYNAECPTASPLSLTFTVNTLDITSVVTPSNFMICQGETLVLDASGADEYEVFVNNVSQGPQSTNSSFVINNLNDGDNITLNGFSSSTSCTQTDDQTIYVQVSESPAITLDGSNTFCEGDSAILYSNSFYGNQWYKDGIAIPGATDTSLTVFSSGDYSLEVVNGGFGEIWSVGYNSNGEFGDNSNYNSSNPSQTISITDIVKISSGFNHTLALESNGDLYVFGDNSSGQLGNGTYTGSDSPILLTTIPAVTDMAAGENCSALVSASGEIFTWGSNNDGQLGLGNTMVYNTPQWIVGTTGYTNITAGRSHFMALKNDGTVWGVGNNDLGQLGLGNLLSQDVFTQVPGLNNIVSIHSGDYHCMAIDNTGALYVWGANSMGQLGLNDLNNRTSPTLSNLDNVSSAAGGNAHSIFVTNDQEVFVTGSNNFGQLGTGDLINRDSPTYINTINAVVAVAAGSHHSLFHKNDGTVWGSGRNDNNQLGDLSPISIQTISMIPDVEGVTYIDGGNESSHFIYGNSSSCTSVIEMINVNSAPLPVITYSGGLLSTSASGVSYEWFIDNIPIVNSNTTSVTPSSNGNYTVVVTYLNGCSRESEIFSFTLAGMDELAAINSISLYPNPTDSKFAVIWNEALEIENIEVFDVFGKRLSMFEIQNTDSTFEFDLSGLADGMYSVIITSKTQISKTLRVVKN
jgi:alpha-tubulin suppressor-like RCC1 family protein